MFQMWSQFNIKKGRNQIQTRNVSLQVSLPMYQNITDETVIEAQPSGSKEGSKEQGTQEQVPERSYVGYYEGTIDLF